MTLYIYATAEAVRELTAAEAAAYEAMIIGDTTHTGAVDGAFAGLPGTTVYAM